MVKHTEGEKVLLRRERLTRGLEGQVGYRLYLSVDVPCSLTAEITDEEACDVVGPLAWVEGVKARLERLYPKEVYTIELA